MVMLTLGDRSRWIFKCEVSVEVSPSYTVRYCLNKNNK